MLPSTQLLPRLRHADPDRFFCTLFAPPAARETLALLYLFNHELARAREVASTPMLALIRLTWWREVVEGTAKAHEIATPLHAALEAGVFTRNDLLAMIDARGAEADDAIPNVAAFLDYARDTAGRLAAVAGTVLGAGSPALTDLGMAYGIAGILRAAPFLARQNRSLLPADGTPPAALIARAQSLLQNNQPPRAGLAAALPAVFARRDLARLAQGRVIAPARGAADKLAVLRAALTGRV